MRIAIIGAGTVGRGLARAATGCGHEVVIAARHPEHAAMAAQEVEARSGQTAAEAARGAEGAIVVDPTNPDEPDLSAILEARLSVAEEIAILLPDNHVVKAFNTVLGQRLTDPVVNGIRLDGFYAGDDPGAKAVVAQLIAAMGFRPLDAGALPAARALEHLAYLNINLNARKGWSWSSGRKLLGDTGEDAPRARG
jgi:8-hydroxy-5-deazaflavin:NADPH oxidoreductase